MTRSREAIPGGFEAEDASRVPEPFEVHFPSAPIVAAPRQEGESADSALDRIFASVDRAAHPFDTRAAARSAALAAANTWFASASMTLASVAGSLRRPELERRRAALARDADELARVVERASVAEARSLAERLLDAARALPAADERVLEVALTSPLAQADRSAAQGEAVLCKPSRAAPVDASAAAGAELVGGEVLPEALRATFAARLAAQGIRVDLAPVRIHTGADGQALCARLHARAVTIGEHIAFAAGEFAPTTTEGAALLAHELTHVAQGQRQTLPSGLVPASSPLEAEADAVGARAARQPESDHDDEVDPVAGIATARRLFAEIARVFEGRPVAPPPVCVVGIGDVPPVAADELGNDAELVVAWRQIREQHPVLWSERRLVGAERLERIAEVERRIAPQLALLENPAHVTERTAAWLETHYRAWVEREKQDAHRAAARGETQAHEVDDSRSDVDARTVELRLKDNLVDAKQIIITTLKIGKSLADGLGPDSTEIKAYLARLEAQTSDADALRVLGEAPGSRGIERLRNYGAVIDFGIRLLGVLDPDERQKLLASRGSLVGKVNVFVKVLGALQSLVQSALELSARALEYFGRLSSSVAAVKEAIGGELATVAKRAAHVASAFGIASNILTILDPDSTAAERIGAGADGLASGLGLVPDIGTPVTIAYAIAIPAFNGLVREGEEAATGPVIGGLRNAMFPRMDEDARWIGRHARALAAAWPLLGKATDPARREAFAHQIMADEALVRARLAPYLAALSGETSLEDPTKPGFYGPSFVAWFAPLAAVPLTTHDGLLAAAHGFVECVARCFAHAATLVAEVARAFKLRHTP